MNENTISYKLNRINNAVDRIRTITKTTNQPIEDVASTVEYKLNNAISVVNGKLDTGYYSSGGAIAPGTFINTIVNTSGLSISDLKLTESSNDNNIQDIHHLKDDYYVLTTYYYIYVFKGTTKITSIKKEKSGTQFIVYSTDDGKNIFLACGQVGYGCYIYHYKFENDILTYISKGETKSVSTMNYTTLNGFTCISKNGDNYKFLVTFSYSSEPYAQIMEYNGASTWTNYNFIALNYTYDCASYQCKGYGIVQLDQNNYLYANANNSSDSFYKGMYKITVAEDNTLTRTELGGVSLVYPRLAKIGNKCVVCAKDVNSTTINLIVYDLSNNANVVYSTAISSFGETGLSNISILIVNINDSNFLIVHTYYDGTNTTIKCIPCILNGDGSVEVGITQTLNKDGSKFKSATKFGTGNAINIANYDELMSGTLNGLEFNIGVKYVSQATKSITGITRTECTESTAGDIYLLNIGEAASE